MTDAIQFHSIANLFPLLEGDAFAELVADIRAHGLREPIVLYGGMILDGRNRYRACLTAGVEPRFAEYTGADPVAYVVSLNIKRRHLDESQRAIVAARIATLKLGDNQHSEGLPIGRASTLLNVGERGRPVPSQLDQVLPRFYVQKAGPYHPFGRIRIAPFGKGGLRILAESGSDESRRINRRLPSGLAASSGGAASRKSRPVRSRESQFSSPKRRAAGMVSSGRSSSIRRVAGGLNSDLLT
jgi:hypothetical protein